MNWIILACVLSFAAISLANGDVVTLTDANFDEYIKKSIVLVKFYAPWCGHCKSLAPEYELAAKKLKDEGSDFVLGELDATVHTKQAQKAAIRSYPTLKLYIDGIPIDFTGDRKADPIVDWIKKKVLPPSTELTNAAEMKEKVNAKGRRVILATDNEEYKKRYLVIARGFEYFTYYHTSEKVAAEVFPGLKYPVVLLYKDFDEKEAAYTGEMVQERFYAFLKQHQLPLINALDKESVEYVFQKAEKKALLFAHAGTNEDIKTKEAELRKIALKFKSDEFLFISGDVQTEMGKPLLNYYGLTEADLPILEIADLTHGELRRYRHTGQIIEKDMEEFFENFKKGKLERYIKSEEIPTVNEGPVYKVVAKNFQKEVIDNDMDVLVKFYAEWCGHCKHLAPVYHAAAEKLKGNKKVKLVECDATKNDIAGHEVNSFPTLKFFPGKSKNAPIAFDGARTEEGIIKFLTEKCSTPIVMPEEKKDL